MRWFNLAVFGAFLSCSATRTATVETPSVTPSPPPESSSMLDLCLAIAKGDHTASEALAQHPLVQKMSEGMAPQVKFTPSDFAHAAFESTDDPRFSFDRLLKNARFAPPFVNYVTQNKTAILSEGMQTAVEFLGVQPDPTSVILNFVCGSPWDAFVLIFEKPELFFDVGFYADDVLEKAVPSFKTILVHELWHLAFREHQAESWPVDYADSPDPEALFFYRMLNEGVGHFYSLHPKLFPEVAYDDFGERSQKVFALLASKFPAYLAIEDEDERGRFLWSSHAGVPFWEKWSAVPAALMTYHLQDAIGKDGVHQLIATEPFSFFIAYDEQAASHPGWPRLPEALVVRAKRCLERHELLKAQMASVRSHLTAPKTLNEKEVAQKVVDAVAIKDAFAAKNGWSGKAEKSLFDSVEVFSEQEALWKRILEINKLPMTTPLPTKGLAAALEGRVLLAVTPQVYEQVAPEYAALPKSWTRLLAHEMVHRLHVEILNGDEDAMGPQWFYEGFAVIGAGQRLDAGLAYTSAEQALTAVADTKSPRVYRRFVAALRYFMTKAPLQELVAKARAPDFEDWLRER